MCVWNGSFNYKVAEATFHPEEKEFQNVYHDGLIYPAEDEEQHILHLVPSCVPVVLGEAPASTGGQLPRHLDGGLDEHAHVSVARYSIIFYYNQSDGKRPPPYAASRL
jgi:hypothetical protein